MRDSIRISNWNKSERQAKDATCIEIIYHVSKENNKLYTIAALYIPISRIAIGIIKILKQHPMTGEITPYNDRRKEILPTTQKISKTKPYFLSKLNREAAIRLPKKCLKTLSWFTMTWQNDSSGIKTLYNFFCLKKPNS